MKIKTKFIWSIYISTAILGMSVLGLTFYLHTLNSKSIINILENTNELEVMSQLELSLSKSIMPANDYLIHGNKDEENIFEYLDANVNKYFSILEEKHVFSHITMQGQETISKLKDQYIQIKTISEKIFNLPNPIGNIDGALLMEEMDLLMENIINDAKELHKYIRQNVLVEVEVMDTHFYRNILIMLSVFGSMIIAAIIYGLFLTKNIIAPIKYSIEYMSYVAMGNFDRKLDIKTNDEIGQLASSFNDMTLKLEESRKRLQESEKHKSQLLNSLKDCIYQCEPDFGGVFTWVNLAGAEMFGYKSPEEMIGTMVKDIYVNHEDRRRFVERLERDGVVRNVEVIFKKKNGDFFHAERTSHIVRDEKGKPVRIEGIIRDISERMKTDEQLRKLSRAVEQSPSAIVITDLTGNIEYVNSTFIQLTGYSFEEAIGKNPRILKSGKQSTEFYKEMWDTIASGKEWRGEFCNKKKSGELYWEFAVISPVNNDEGVITHFIADMEDITERKKSESLLNAQHAVTQILSVSTTVKEAVQNVLQAVCVMLNWDFGVLWIYNSQDNALHCLELWHDPAVEMSEFTEKTKEISFSLGIGLPGRVWASGKPAWIIDVVRDTNFPRAAAALKVGLHGVFDFPIIINKEVLGTIEFFSKKPQEPDNDLLNMMPAIVNQIALFIKRNQAVKELVESEDKLNKITSAANDAIIMLNNDEEVSYWNNASEKIFGYSIEEAVGKNICNLIIPERYRERHLEGFERFKATGIGNLIGKTVEVEAVKKNGMEISVELSLSAVKRDGKWNAIGIIRDISERKRIEQELRVSHKMMSVGRLSASVFHEILNPVNIISAHTQLLLMEAEKGSKAEEDLSSIQGEIARIVDITDSLLKFTKDEGGDVEKVEINGLLENILSLLRTELMSKSIKPVLKLDNELPEVAIHGSELRQAFLNIISNAMDAMPGGGTLTVKTKRVRSKEIGARSYEFEVGNSESRRKGSELKGDFVEISFSDTGSGIAKDDIDKVFEPFFSTKKEIKGVGLGLSSSYAIINGYGGKLSVESEEGKGTTIMIILPVST